MLGFVRSAKVGRTANALIFVLVLAFLTAAPGTALASVPGQVSGRVEPVSIAPEVEVCLVEPQPSESCTSPGAEGDYDLTGLPAGQPFKIEFVPSLRSGFQVQYWRDASTSGEALAIELSRKAPQIGEINARLEPVLCRTGLKTRGINERAGG
jgi:hypothetical protein